VSAPAPRVGQDFEMVKSVDRVMIWDEESIAVSEATDDWDMVEQEQPKRRGYAEVLKGG
jgi:hypothetical protein